MHCLAIGCLSQMTKWNEAKLPSREAVRTVVVLVDGDEERREQKVKVVRGVEIQAPSISRPVFSPITLPPPEVQQSESAPSTIDWRAEGRRAVRGVLREGRESSRSRAVEPDEGAAESKVFGSQSANRRAGKVETFDDGERHWISDNCYFDFDRRPVDSTLASDLRVQTVRCKGQPTGGGASMFKDLVPKYLEAGKQDDVTDPK
jgi:hypothetical protein